jgi:chromosomal replication initiation ATPase DnaA
MHPELARAIDRARVDRLVRAREAEETLHKVKLEHARVVKFLGEKIASLQLLVDTLRAKRAKRQKPALSLHAKFEAIKRVVCERHKITNAELCSHERLPEYVWARQLVCWLARDMTSLSTTQIAERLGNRDHTTIMHGARQVARKMRADPAIEEEVMMLTKLITERISQNAKAQSQPPGAPVSQPLAENQLEGAQQACGVGEGV